MKTAAIIQPTYLPWIGYFDLIDQSDIFVFLDNVQLVKRSWDIRNRIKTASGELFLSLSFRKDKHRDETLFCNANLDDTNPWRKKHLKSIELSYHCAPYCNEIYPLLDSLINSRYHLLSEFNINIITALSQKMGITTIFVKASELKGLEGAKDVRLVAICKEIDCDQYISPQGAAVYIEREKPGGEFSRQAIDLYYQNFDHPVYKQLYGDFLPFMSIIDLLFNYGFADSLKIIRTGRRQPIDFMTFREKMER